MSELYKRIRARRETLGMTQDELAMKLHYKSRSSINKIEMGQNDIPQSKIKAFADALYTTPTYLMGWEEEPTPKRLGTQYASFSFSEKLNEEDKLHQESRYDSGPQQLPGKMVCFPIVSTVAGICNGTPVESFTGDSFFLSWEDFEEKNPADYFVWRVKDKSMFPLFLEEDLLLLHRGTSAAPGSIVLFFQPNFPIQLRKLGPDSNDYRWHLQPINPEYPSKEIILDGEAPACHIVGRVVLQQRKF